MHLLRKISYLPSRTSRISSALLVLALLLLASSSGVSESDSYTSSRSGFEPLPYPDDDPLWEDAGHLASDVGISVDEAMAAVDRQPQVGRLLRALEERGPSSFGGLFIDYTPEYRITLLASPGGHDEVDRAVGELGFSELAAFTTTVETAHTEDVLEGALDMVKDLGGELVTTIDLDLRTGEIIATAASPEDVEAVRAAIHEADPPFRHAELS